MTRSIHTEKHSWWQFRLRTLLIAFAVISIFMGTFVAGGLRQKRAIESLRAIGVEVAYRSPSTGFVWDSDGPAWSRFKLAIGRDFFDRVELVGYEWNEYLTIRIRRDSSTGPFGADFDIPFRQSSFTYSGIFRNFGGYIYSIYAQADSPASPPAGQRPWPRRLRDENIEQLAYISHLKGIHLSSTELTNQGLARLADIKSLEVINLCDVANPVDNAVVANPEEPCAAITPAGLAHLGKLPRLSGLGLYIKNGLESDLQFLSECNSLKELDFSRLKLPGHWLKHLPSLPNLERIRLPGGDEQHAGFIEADLAELARFPRLTEIEIHGSARLQGLGLAQLSRLPNLSKLVLDCSHFENEWLKHLAGLKSLRHLELGNAPLEDEPLQSLAELTELEYIELNGKAAVRAIEFLKTLEALREVRCLGDEGKGKGFDPSALDLLRTELPQLAQNRK